MSGLSHEYQYLSETATAIIGTWPISTQFSVSRIIVEQSGYFTWTCSPESRYFVQPVRSRVQESGTGGSWPDVAHLTLCNTGRISLLANSFECLMISWFKSFGRLILRGSFSSEGSTLILSRFNSSRACLTLSRDLQTASKNWIACKCDPWLYDLLFPLPYPQISNCAISGRLMVFEALILNDIFFLTNKIGIFLFLISSLKYSSLLLHDDSRWFIQWEKISENSALKRPNCSKLSHEWVRIKIEADFDQTSPDSAC